MRRYIWILILGIFLLSGCQNKTAIKMESHIYDYFDTDVSFIAYVASKEEFEKYEKILEEELKRYHEEFDIYNNYEINNLKTINDLAGKEEVEVSDDIIDLIQWTLEQNKIYGDEVNIAMGEVLQLWHDKREQALDGKEAEIPSLEELKEAKKSANLEDIIIKDNKVFLNNEKMSLDLGAVAKGYATEKIAQTLEEEGLTSFILNAGGNVKAVGKPLEKNRDQWGIGIQNPHVFEDDSSPSIVKAYYGNDISVVTSGDYQRFYEVDGVKLHHIIDPDTLMPGDHFLSTTVITEDSALADYLSTTLFLMDYEKGRALVDSMDNVDAMWIMKDDQIITTWDNEE
ncbi:MAG: FAD:protein FMN transferase [Tissierellia bacterium]|nr:FAD:protein FMN transferase [Tissierellia bacterium]